MKITFITLVLLLGGCQATETPENTLEKDLCNTWVLVEKDKKGVKEKHPSDDAYPITLTLDSIKIFRGKHDANSYEGTYELHQNTISFSYGIITDVADIDWYIDYLSELTKMSEVWLPNTNNLRLSTQADSITLYFVSMETYVDMEK